MNGLKSVCRFNLYRSKIVPFGLTVMLRALNRGVRNI
jgi:hypothetical protein